MNAVQDTEPSGALVAGVDEVGRGPLAGPVYAAAVILGSMHGIVGLADSKTLTVVRRARLDEQIRLHATAWAIGIATVEEIDALNILQASLLAMRRAVAALVPHPTAALVDGNRCPVLDCPTTAIVKGDSKIPAIAAASIVAKVARDNHMLELDRCYPGYGFACHKGYPTVDHLDALLRLGITPVHRRSFAPVRRCLLGETNFILCQAR